MFATSDAKDTLESESLHILHKHPFETSPMFGRLPDSGDVRLIPCCACQCRSEHSCHFGANKVSFLTFEYATQLTNTESGTAGKNRYAPVDFALGSKPLVASIKTEHSTRVCTHEF